MYNLIVNNLYIFDPTKKDPLSQFRGGGRILQILKENLPEAKFIDNLNQFSNYNYQLGHGRDVVGNNVFINPIFNPFQPPITFRRLAKKQIQIIFDIIPLKYPTHFPIGLKGKFNLWLNKLALTNYDKIITISGHSKKDTIQYLKIPEEKIEVVYPTIIKAFSNSKLVIRNLEKISNYQLPITNYCLYVGDVNWNKNLVNLAKAIKIINVTCVFVGKAFEIARNNTKEKKQYENTRKMAKNADLRKCHAWLPTTDTLSTLTSLMHFRKDAFEPKNHPWQKEFNQFLKEVKNDKRFIFLDYVDDYRLIKLYQQAKVNVLISRDEGFGFSYLEAASQGCPSVLSDIDVFHETSADSAWFANSEDPHDIANKIGEIYFNKDLRDKLGKKAYQRSRYFSQEKFKKDFLKALK